MEKVYQKIDFVNNTTPALNADNLNAISEALNEIDTRVAKGYAGAVQASLLIDQMNQIKDDTVAQANAVLSGTETVAQNAEASAQAALASEENALTYKNDAEAAAALARETAENIGAIIVPKGSVLFENLPNLASMAVGDMYNILNDFVTTADFIIGVGFPYPLGTNVYKTQGGLLDVFAGAVRVDNDTIKYNAAGQLTLALDDAESEGF
ncbi:MAG: hypothetical protein KBT06_05130 [Prevotellaceae bacterium]|nr:hypothetical protein [Candidatus Colivivens equi]